MTLDDQHVENTLYFTRSTWDSSTASSLAIALLAWWGDNYAPLVSELVSFREVVITDLSEPEGFQVTLAPTTPLNGGMGPEEALPSNVSLSVSFRTASRGRSFRGRNYVVGMSSEQIVLNTVTPEVVSAWQAAYTALLDVADSVTAVWVVASRFSGVDTSGHPIPRTEGITTEINNVVIADNTSDSQRRRLPGRGR
jgi:hypothetical protein